VKELSNKGWILIFIIGGLVYLLGPVLTPFLSGALLAYLGNGLVSRLEKLKWPRVAAVTFVFGVVVISLIAALLILVPLLEAQVASLIDKLPGMIVWFKDKVVPWVQMRMDGFFHLDVDKIQKLLRQNIGSAGGLLTGFFASLSSSGAAFLATLANLVLIPVVTFYLLRDWPVLVDKLYETLPRRFEKKANLLAKEVDTVLGAFFKGQMMVMMGLATIYSVGLSLIKLDFSLLIGLLAGVVSFVPYLGLVIGLLLATVAAIFQFHDFSYLLPIVLVFTVGQVLESVVLTPLLVGDKIGLHPVAVIFAVMAGGQLFGFTGVLLALPVAAVLMVFLQHAIERYKKSSFYQQV